MRANEFSLIVMEPSTFLFSKKILNMVYPSGSHNFMTVSFALVVNSGGLRMYQLHSC